MKDNRKRLENVLEETRVTNNKLINKIGSNPAYIVRERFFNQYANKHPVDFTTGVFNKVDYLEKEINTFQRYVKRFYGVE